MIVYGIVEGCEWEGEEIRSELYICKKDAIDAIGLNDSKSECYGGNEDYWAKNGGYIGIREFEIQDKTMKNFAKDKSKGEIRMTARELKIGERYKLTYPNNAECVAILNRILTYPAADFPSDYIFEWISGEDTLPKTSSIPGMFFPLTARHLSYVVIASV